MYVGMSMHVTVTVTVHMCERLYEKGFLSDIFAVAEQFCTTVSLDTQRLCYDFGLRCLSTWLRVFLWSYHASESHKNSVRS